MGAYAFTVWYWRGEEDLPFSPSLALDGALGFDDRWEELTGMDEDPTDFGLVV